MKNGNIFMSKLKEIKAPKAEKASSKKIGTKLHTCSMGPTADPRYLKCYLCSRVDKV